MNKTTLNSKGKKVIGVDIGGTKISAGLVESGKIYKSVTVHTPECEFQEEVIDAIVAAINNVISKDTEGIGIGIPGLINTTEGIAYDVHNIPSFKTVHLKEILEVKLGKMVRINNDANCFTLGAKSFGEGKKFTNIVGLTLGTGLGGGVIIDNQLLEGVTGGAGEFGFLPYKNGILEHYCSGQFFKRQYNISGEDAYFLAIQGNVKALDIFSHFGQHLGEAIKIVAHILAPEAVMLGGSISKNFELFQKSMWESIKQFPYSHVTDNLVVMPVSDPNIAILGAASLVDSLN